MDVEPLASVMRSGFAESIHHGMAVILAPDGSTLLSVGSTGRPMYPRSAVKPIQALAMLGEGLQLDGELLALASASHSGEQFHLDGVREILAPHGLDASALQNTPDLPLDPAERLSWQRLGLPASSLAQNCSGKHAAMLATCAVNRWSTQDYLDPEHPLQRAIKSTIGALAGEPVTHSGVDGCGAPLHAISLRGLARAFSSIASAVAESAVDPTVAAAMRGSPEWVGGTGRPVTRLMRGIPGLIAKEGAEAVLAAALPDGCAMAVKIADGSSRALWPVSAALLRRLGCGAGVLDEIADEPVLGHGVAVGRIEVTDVVLARE